MILANGLVMDGNFQLRKLDLRIGGGKIAELGENLSGDKKFDLRGKYILPGFIDTHIHGAYGNRIGGASADLNKISEFEASQGVTSIAITTASSSFEDLLNQIEDVVRAGKTCKGAKIAGIHAEGPFLNVKYKGAMTEKNIIAPKVELLDRMLERADGMLKIITVAPDAEGAGEFIKYAVGKGVTVSMGHTDATYDVAISAINAGATQATHTFNAMRSLHHREPGVLGVVLTRDEVTCEMICDYVHLHPAICELIYKTKGADHINMVSDSGHAAGLEVSEFEVDGIKRYVKDGVVRLADGTIAGSARTLFDGVKNLIKSGIPMGDVSKMASLNPAKSLKLEKEIGSIAVGKLADLVVLDGENNVSCTFVDGECIYSAG